MNAQVNLDSHGCRENGLDANSTGVSRLLPDWQRNVLQNMSEFSTTGHRPKAQPLIRQKLRERSPNIGKLPIALCVE
jgi:hypothetical protein